jgi:hypothetical protein
MQVCLMLNIVENKSYPMRICLLMMKVQKREAVMLYKIFPCMWHQETDSANIMKFLLLVIWVFILSHLHLGFVEGCHYVCGCLCPWKDWLCFIMFWVCACVLTLLYVHFQFRTCVGRDLKCIFVLGLEMP